MLAGKTYEALYDFYQMDTNMKIETQLKIKLTVLIKCGDPLSTG